VQGAFVSGRVDRHGLDAELVQRANDPHRDLSAICYEDAFEPR